MMGACRPSDRVSLFTAQLTEGLAARGRPVVVTAGWALTAYDDAPHRFFALAERR